MKFKTSHVPGAAAPTDRLFTERERRKLLLMSVLFLGVAGSMVWGWFASQGAKPASEVTGPVDAPQLTELVTPVFRGDELRARAKDSTREERAELETPALAVALADARLYNWVHYEAMGGAELDAARAAELLAAPAPARGRLLRLRGRIEELVSYPETPDLPAHFRGLLALDDGTRAFVAFQTCAEYEFGLDDYVHVDGMFVKALGREVAGAWVEAPLVVGPRAQVSYPAMGKVTSLARSDLDRDFGVLDELASSERDEFWRVVSYTRDVDQGTVDWAKAPLLDRATMDRLSQDPQAFLAVPVRIPPCRIQDIWTQRQRENPARVTVLSEGWIGANEWLKTANPVIQFATLLPDPGYRIGSEVTARGYFVHMRQYEAVGGTRSAPVFVLSALDPYEMPRESVFSTVLGIVALSLLALVALFWYLLRRDNAKSRELDAELQRRKRARLSKVTAGA